MKPNEAGFKQIYTLKLFIAFKMAYSDCFSLGGNLDFPEFHQKKFYNINYRPHDVSVNKAAKGKEDAHIVDVRRLEDDLCRRDHFELFPGEEAQPGQRRDGLQNLGPVAVQRSFQPKPVDRLRLLRLSEVIQRG